MLLAYLKSSDTNCIDKIKFGNDLYGDDNWRKGMREVCIGLGRAK